ncbi:MAG: tripartite tricarboxylate transporter substrate binding protein [Burkholderiales bacterium]|nr:tripartite tricarboxylate transporter substrate binding protein [Burkholderiales bacterium]
MRTIESRAARGNVPRGRSPRIIAPAALACLALGNASAQPVAYPVKPVRLVVAYAPGGLNDILGRMAARKISEALRQSVVVENRPGASGLIGLDLVAKASPDGYTLGMGSSGNLAILPHLQSVPYDALRSFAPVSNTALVPYVLAVNAAVPARSVQELIALARKRSGFLSYASGAPTSRLAAELFKSMARVNIVYVPYRGTAPALVELAGGHTDMMIADQGLVRPLARGGKLRMLATTGLRRIRVLAELPTLAESGLPGYDITAWSGVVAPAATPNEIVRLLHGAIAAGMRAPDVQAQLDELGYEPLGDTPEQFAAKIRSELALFGKIARDAGIKGE